MPLATGMLERVGRGCARGAANLPASGGPARQTQPQGEPVLARRIRLEAPKSPIAPVNRMHSTANPMPLGSLWGLRWDTGVGCETGMPLHQRREPLLPSPAASAVRRRIARASRSRTPACLQSPFRWKPGMRRRHVNRRLTVGRRLATVYSRRLSCHHSDFYSISVIVL